MGVSGSGKSTVAELLAARLGWIYADADDDHPARNVEKMRAGQSLDSSDREPWLRILRERIAGWLASERCAVLACSALTRASRAMLRVDPERVHFAHLTGARETILERMERRQGHFMPPDLLDEQFATLERPSPEEAIEVNLADEPEEIVDEICRRLRLRRGRLS